MSFLKKYLRLLIESKITKLVNVAGAIIVKPNTDYTDSVLLIQRSEDDHWPLVWEFPRGKCDMGDSNNLIKCLKREVKEETGLTIKVIKFIDNFSYMADQGTRKSTQYNYLCKLDPPNQKIKLSHEHQDYRWITSVGECELLVSREMVKTISKVLNREYSIVNYDNTNTSKIKE